VDRNWSIRRPRPGLGHKRLSTRPGHIDRRTSNSRAASLLVLLAARLAGWLCRTDYGLQVIIRTPGTSSIAETELCRCIWTAGEKKHIIAITINASVTAVVEHYLFIYLFLMPILATEHAASESVENIGVYIKHIKNPKT